MSRAVALALAVLAVACTGEDGRPVSPEGEGAAGSGLARLVLRAEEAPEGLEPSDGGPIATFRGILPSRRRDPSLPPMPDRLRGAFEAGYRRSFAGGGRAASSTVVRMADPTSAAELLAYLRLLPVGGQATTPVEVPATGLGEEGYGWHLLVPENESSGYVWLSGELVASLTLSGPVGAAGPEVSLGLAERVDGRLA